tara:strand:- start:12221 stop:12592 length:372 start_codon:yes stop_codon:yes gene_type:complete
MTLLLYTLLYTLSYINILPPISNVYHTNINIPFIGNQDITYKRTEYLKSEIKLSGKINQKGYIYYDMSDPYKYTLDDGLKIIINKYRCSIEDPIYDNNNDILELKIKINLINYKKRLTFNKLN